MAKIRKEGKKELPPISTASLPDIIFILLFFFMVVTVMRNNETKVKQVLPQATELTKIQKKSLVEYIFIGEPMPSYQATYGTAPRIQLNDAFASIDDVPGFVSNARNERIEAEQNAIIFALRVDVDTKMGIVQDVKTELRKVDALKINYSSRPREGAITLGGDDE